MTDIKCVATKFISLCLALFLCLNALTTTASAVEDEVKNIVIKVAGYEYYNGKRCVKITGYDGNDPLNQSLSYSDSFNATHYHSWSSTPHVSGAYAAQYTSGIWTVYIYLPNVSRDESRSCTCYFTVSGSWTRNGELYKTYSGTSNTVSFTLSGSKTDPLSTPTLQLTTPSKGVIHAEWNAISHATSYTIKYGTTTSCTSGTYTTTNAYYDFNDLQPGQLYYVKVQANSTDDAYTSSSWDTQSIIAIQDPLDVPSINSLLVLNSNSLQCRYTTVENATGYIIEYSTSSDFSNKKTITTTS